MKKRDFSKKNLSKLAIMGLAAGLMVSNSAAAESYSSSNYDYGQQIARGSCPGGKCPQVRQSNNGRTRRYNPENNGQIAMQHDDNGNGNSSCSAKSGCNGTKNGNGNGNEKPHKEDLRKDNGNSVNNIMRDNGQISMWQNNNENGNGKSSCSTKSGCNGTKNGNHNEIKNGKSSCSTKNGCNGTKNDKDKGSCSSRQSCGGLNL